MINAFSAMYCQFLSKHCVFPEKNSHKHSRHNVKHSLYNGKHLPHNRKLSLRNGITYPTTRNNDPVTGNNGPVTGNFQSITTHNKTTNNINVLYLNGLTVWRDWVPVEITYVEKPETINNLREYDFFQAIYAGKNIYRKMRHTWQKHEYFFTRRHSIIGWKHPYLCMKHAILAENCSLFNWQHAYILLIQSQFSSKQGFLAGQHAIVGDKHAFLGVKHAILNAKHTHRT